MIGVLVVLTHLPLFLLILVGWIFLARTGRHWAHRNHPGHQSGHARPRPARLGQMSGSWRVDRGSCS